MTAPEDGGGEDEDDESDADGDDGPQLPHDAL